MNSKWYNSDFATLVGFGLMCFFFLSGMGSCAKLAFEGDAKRSHSESTTNK